MGGGAEQPVMAHPHFRDDDEAQCVDSELWRQIVHKLRKRILSQLTTVRRPQVTYHYHHEDSDDAIAECLNSAGAGQFRDRLHSRSPAYIPSGPRWIATIPVRETSTSPSGSISAMKLSILSEAPVISNTKLSVPASTT